jgi:hypothetical protein
MACDVDTVLLRRLSVLGFIHHDSRVRIAGISSGDRSVLVDETTQTITSNPAASWVTQQARNLSMDPADQATPVQVPHPRPRHQVHRLLRRHLRRRRRQRHHHPRPSTECQYDVRAGHRHHPARMPRPDAHPPAPPPRSRARRYVEHYYAHRPHWSLSQRAPCTLDTVPALIGDVDVAQLRRTDRLGALIHEYPHGRPSWADGVLGPLGRMGSRAHSSVGGAAPGEASTCL